MKRRKRFVCFDGLKYYQRLQEEILAVFFIESNKIQSSVIRANLLTTDC